MQNFWSNFKRYCFRQWKTLWEGAKTHHNTTNHHLVGVVVQVVGIWLVDLDFAQPRPTKSRLLLDDDLGVSEPLVPNCCSNCRSLALVSFNSWYNWLRLLLLLELVPRRLWRLASLLALGRAMGSGFTIACN